MQGFRDLQITAGVVLLTVVSITVPPISTTFIRTALGVPMVLFLPGYALIAALFPGKNDLDGTERLALSFGLSIAVVPLIGLGLNFTPFGIRESPVLLSLSLFTVLMCAAAHSRRYALSESERFSVPFSAVYLKGELGSGSRTEKALTAILILAIAASTAMLIYVVATPKQGEKFTEFYILGDRGKAEGYPTHLEAGRNSSIIAGVVNHEYALTNYTLEVLLDNDTLGATRIYLDHNSTWENRVFFTPEKRGSNLKLEFLLYREENFTAPYRDLHLWVNIT